MSLIIFSALPFWWCWHHSLLSFTNKLSANLPLSAQYDRTCKKQKSRKLFWPSLANFCYGPSACEHTTSTKTIASVYFAFMRLPFICPTKPNEQIWIVLEILLVVSMSCVPLQYMQLAYNARLLRIIYLRDIICSIVTWFRWMCHFMTSSLILDFLSFSNSDSISSCFCFILCQNWRV